MKKFIKIISFFLLVSIVVCLSGCGEKLHPPIYKLPNSLTTIDSGLVCDNSNFSLFWDNDSSAVTVYDKVNDRYWSTTPYNYLISGKNGGKYVDDGLMSGISVKYYNSQKKAEAEISAYSGAEYITAAKNQNKMRVMYYFDSLGFSIPIIFSLEKTGVSVSVEIDKISEKNNKVISISLLPFFASTENSENNYIFVPSGCGAIMKSDSGNREVRYYSESIYGSDPTSQSIYDNTTEKSVRLPVFGVKSEKCGMLGIVTNGAEFADVKATVGDSEYGYSGVYAAFNIRGVATTYIKSSQGGNSEVKKYTDTFVNVSKATVKYIMLSQKDCDYNGMARCYKKYLSETQKLTSSTDTPDLMLDFLGAYNVRKIVAGVPYNTLNILTSCDDTLSIIKDIDKNITDDFSVNLNGYTSSGLDYGEYAGGFKIDGNLGNKKSQSKLFDWCKKNNVDAFLDLDLIFFNKTASGFSTRKSATTVNDTRAMFYDYSIPTHSQDTTGRKAYLANRYSLVSSIDLICKKIKKSSATGVGLSTLSNVCFSDYRDTNYYCGAHMSDDVNKIITAVKNQKTKAFGKQANMYAAVNLDYIYGSPTSSSNYYALDCDIPFYQMIFRGKKAISGEAINLATNGETEFLKSVSTGLSLAYSVCDHTDGDLFGSVHSAAAASEYDGIKNDIHKNTSKIKPLLKEIRDAGIESYYINNNVSKTVFDNGTVVYVNFGEKEADTEFGKVKARSFIYR